MDTTTVNYAIEKLNEAFQHIKPTAIELGSEFVGYTVLKVTVAAGLIVLFFTVLIFVALYFLRKGLKCERHLAREECFTASAIAGSVGFITALFGTEVVYDAILANNFPLMYTIEQLAK